MIHSRRSRPIAPTSVLWIPPLVGGFLLLVPSCGGAPAHGELPKGAKREEPRSVRVVRPQTDSTDDSFPSSLYVEHDVQVTARRPGVVEAVFVDRGDHVRKGQALARVEAEAAERQLDLAVADERLARAEYERLAVLSRQQVVSPQDLDRAETVLKRATSRTAIARNDLDRCTVAAPFDGVVAERWAVVGRRVTDDTDSPPLFRVVASEPLRARVDVPEERLSGIARGGQAQIEPPGGGNARAARVVFLSPAIDAASGTASVIVETPEVDALRPGASVRVRFQPMGHGARS